MHGVALDFFGRSRATAKKTAKGPGPHVFIRALATALAAIASIALALTTTAAPKANNDIPPLPSREFRGAWIATVANIDWPSKPGLSSVEQRAELIAIIERAAQLKLNALVFQVRPSCDAFYSSRLEPWSEYLTGKMGQPPNPFYDPLAFAIEQAHLRGLELHAWFNPFRARYLSPKSAVATNHISLTHSKLVRTYGKYLWLDPGEKAAQEHARAVILDVVKRYDIDAVHLDDYFYPYKEKDASGKLMEFPDEPSWKRYVASGGKLIRPDWRRKNVDDFIQHLYQSVKREKPWVKFGISPFGIWRPGHPEQIRGLDAYDQLFADSRKWLANGWLDYLAPQLYWGIRTPEQSYPVLLQWWASQNAKKRHLWPGNNSTKVGAEWRAEEIVNQVQLTRKQSGATGNIYWNMTSLKREHGGLAGALSKQVYAQPALVPASPWLDKQPPGKPQISIEKDRSSRITKLSWKTTGSEPAWLWILQTKTGANWKTEILPAREVFRTFANGVANPQPDFVAITAVDRCSNAGPTAWAETKTELLSRLLPP
jgi:uncharacterized lipoprotein YddW (UPF0748 family)